MTVKAVQEDFPHFLRLYALKKKDELFSIFLNAFAKTLDARSFFNYSNADSEKERIEYIKASVEPENAKAKPVEKSEKNVPKDESDSFTVNFINIPLFYLGLTDSVKKSIVDFSTRKPLNGLILDLSDNGGGNVPEALKLAQLFIGDANLSKERIPKKRAFDSIQKILQEDQKSTTLVQSVVSDDTLLFQSQDEDPLYTGPLVILVSPSTGSAAELFAGILQVYRRAVIVGSASTFENGIIGINLQGTTEFRQEELPVYAGVSVGIMYLPDGTSFQHSGIRPDIIFPHVNDSSQPKEKDSFNSIPEQPKMDAFESDIAKLQTQYPSGVVTDDLKSYLIEESRKRVQVDPFFHGMLSNPKKRELFVSYKSLHDLHLIEKETVWSSNGEKGENPFGSEMSNKPYLEEAGRVLNDFLHWQSLKKE